MSQATVSRAVLRGSLPAALVTPGGHRRFDPDAVDRLAGRLDGRGAAERLLTTHEAAQILGVSAPTLSRAVREGRIHAAVTTPGGHRRFALGDLAGLAARSNKPS